MIRCLELAFDYVRVKKERLLIYVDTPWIQAVVVSLLTVAGFNVATVRSSDSHAVRNYMMDAWNDPKSKLQLFVANVNTLATGLNIYTYCSKGLFLCWHLNCCYDSDHRGKRQRSCGRCCKQTFNRYIASRSDCSPQHPSATIDNGAISETGRLAAKLPAHPVWYKAIVEGHKLDCSDNIISIAALNSTQNSIFARPHDVRYVADLAHTQFACPVSDHISQLNALHAYVRVSSQGKVDMDMWCFETFLDRRTLEEVIQIRIQLKDMAERLLKARLKAANFGNLACHTNIRKALARSFFYRSAIYSDKGDDIYATVHDSWPAGIHPESSLVGINHEWVIFSEFVHTGRQYMQNITAVDPEWLIVRFSIHLYSTY